MEGMRIFKNKKMLLFTVALLCLNVIFFVKDQYTQQDNLQEQRKLRQECGQYYHDWDLKKAAKDLEEKQDRALQIQEIINYEELKRDSWEYLDDSMKKTVRRYETSHKEAYQEYKKNKGQYTPERIQVEISVYQELHDRYAHIVEFQKKLEQIRKNQEKMAQVSIFKNSQSTERSIDKTTKDYQRLQNIKTELGNDNFLTAVFSYDKNMYFIVAFLFAVIWQMLAERKKGLWVVVYGTAGGRTRLAVRRVFLLLAGVAVFLLANESLLYLASGILYGPETNWERSVQSIPLFSGWTIPMTEWQFLLADLVVLWMAGVFAALFAWLVFVAVDNRVLAMTAILSVYFAGYLLYSGLSDQNYLVILRYWNVYYFLHADQVFSSYRNLRVMGQVWNRMPAVCLVMLLGILLFAVAGIVIHTRRHPCHKQNILERGLEFVAEKVRGVTAHFSVFTMELYKLLVMQKGAWILLILLYLSISSIDTSPITYSSQEQFVNQFYKEYAGPLQKDTLKALRESEQKAKEKTKQHDKAVADYKKGKISEWDKEVAERKYEAAQGIIQGSALMRSRINYLLRVQKVLQQHMWVVNPSGYDRLFGELSYDRQMKENLKVLAATVFLLAGVLAFERKKGTKEILCATQSGREELLVRKVLAGGTCAMLAFICVKTATFISLAELFPFTGWLAPLKSLPGMVYNNWDCSILTYYGLILLMQAAGIAVFGMFIGAVSAFLPAEAAVAAGIVPLIPSFLDLFGLSVPMPLSLARLSTIIQWQSSGGAVLVYLLYWFVIVTIACLSWQGMERCWGKNRV